MSEAADKLLQDVVCAGVDFKYWHEEFLKLCDRESKSSHLKPDDKKKLAKEQAQAAAELKKAREELFKQLQILEVQIRASRITGQAGEEHSPGSE